MDACVSGWGANMALRRRAIDRAGRFDEGWHGPGDEEEWERRYTAAGGVVRYLAGPGSITDGPPRTHAGALSRAAYRQGRGRATTTCARARRRRWPASCARSSGVSGTWSGAAAWAGS